MKKNRLFLLVLLFSAMLSYGYSAESVHEESKPLVIVIFGATGDLTEKKVMPAIYRLASDSRLSEKNAVIGVGRRAYSNDVFRKEMRQAIGVSLPGQKADDFWNDFEKGLFYHQSDFEKDAGYEELQRRLVKLDEEFGGQSNRLYYLATPPSAFPTIIEKLHRHRLIFPVSNSENWSRVIIEKPFGRDLDSAIDLQDHISKYLDESQIYRIDHFLGKEGVQNLLSFRFENALFEPLWNKRHIDNIQITLSEEIGIGTRANFWEETGLLRDLVQNHLIQLLSLIAMEPPSSLNGQEIHAEKIKLLHAIRPIPQGEIDQHVISGQYDSGELTSAKGTKVPGYRQEKGVPSESVTETFTAAKLFIDNDRWQGVPFYIRSGKRMALKTTEIVVTFKNSDQTLFIRIQPDPGIFLKTKSKKTNSIVQLDSYIGKASGEAYEKLIFDCIRGDASLFVQADEQLASWRLFSPVLRHWKTNPPKNFPNYKAGTWGPPAVDEWFKGTNRKWDLLETNPKTD